MKAFLKTAVIALSVALTGLTGMAVTAPAAHADTLEFRVGPGGVDVRDGRRWGTTMTAGIVTVAVAAIPASPSKRPATTACAAPASLT